VGALEDFSSALQIPPAFHGIGHIHKAVRMPKAGDNVRICAKNQRRYHCRQIQQKASLGNGRPKQKAAATRERAAAAFDFSVAGREKTDRGEEEKNFPL